MSVASEQHWPAENRLLAGLPREHYQRLLPNLEAVALELKAGIYEPNQPIPHVYFPNSGVISLVTMMDDGMAVEVATVGNEGMVGLPVFLGGDSIPGRAFVQIRGEALRMQAAAFKAALHGDSPLHALLQRYTQALFNQVAQSAACNRLHSIEERCSRWLLMTHDRVRADEFHLTQEFLAQMLGVRRPSVNAVAGILQKAGLIRYSRGKITVLDRAGLEAATCRCYGIIKGEYARLLG